MSKSDQLMPIEEICSLIRDIPDFPKPGIVFKDITPVLERPKAFQSLAQHFAESIEPGATHLLAIESRGFILGAAVAQYLDMGMVLVRKEGKLPGETVSFTYDLEYGSDTLEIHKDAIRPGDKVVIIDDVLATGGTAHAVESMCRKMGVDVLGFRFLLEIESLAGVKKLEAHSQSFLKV